MLKEFFVYVVLTDTSVATILTPGGVDAALCRRRANVNFNLCIFPESKALLSFSSIYPSLHSWISNPDVADPHRGEEQLSAGWGGKAVLDFNSQNNH